MTVDEALRQGAKRLSSFSTSPRLDSEVLLAHLLRVERSALLARLSDQLPQSILGGFQFSVERRARGEPVAYITGHKEFYGLDLLITSDVLVPRPETESVVDACLEVLGDEDMSQLADIGTGSGAILIAVGVHRPHISLHGTDLSLEALEVARANCERHGVAERTRLYQGNLLEPLQGRRFKVIAANLPYVPPGEAAPDVATCEPRVAVFGGGDDGMGVMRAFLNQAPQFLLPGGRVVMETAHSQGGKVAHLASQAFPAATIEVRKDLAGYDRIVVIQN